MVVGLQTVSMILFILADEEFGNFATRPSDAESGKCEDLGVRVKALSKGLARGYYLTGSTEFS